MRSKLKTIVVYVMHKTSGKTKNKLGGRCLVGHIADPRNKRRNEQKTEEREDLCPERPVAPQGMEV
jgi:hypothetical protein